MKQRITLLILIVFSTITSTAQEVIEEEATKNALRLQFLGPAKSVLGLEYERRIGLQSAMLVEAGYIGLNDSEVVDAGAKGAIGGLGLKMYGKNYHLRRKQNSNASILGGFYGTARLTFENYSVRNVYSTYNITTGLITTNVNSYKRSVGSGMLGIGINFNIFKNITLDLGYMGGFIIIDDNYNNNLLFSTASFDGAYHHGFIYAEYILPYTMRGYINIGVNF